MIELPDGTKAVNWTSSAGASTFLACFMRKMILAVESQDEEDFNRRLQSAVLSRVLKSLNTYQRHDIVNIVF